MSLRCHLLLCLPVLLGLQSCTSGSILPSEDTQQDSPWQSFQEAKAAYDLVIPNYTTTTELKELGFDPYATPNVTILTYLDVIQRFLPNDSIKMEHLDEGVRKCILAREACYAYYVNPQQRSKKRVGNVALDVMNFRKETYITGWTFKALLVIHEDQVVYKIWGGTPRESNKKNRETWLGPLEQVKDLF